MKVVFAALGQEQLGISILSGVLQRAGIETSLVFAPALSYHRYHLELPRRRDLFNQDDDAVGLAAPAVDCVDDGEESRVERVRSRDAA